MMEKILDFRWVRFPKRTHRKGVLRLAKEVFRVFGRFFGAPFGWLVGLMLLNSTGETLRRKDAMEGKLPVQHGADEGEL